MDCRSLNLTFFALIALMSGISAQVSDTPSRSVDANVLTSTASPAVRIAIDPTLEFVGKESYVLYRVAQVQRFNFAELDGPRIKKLLIFQFESYLPGNEYTYEIEAKDPIELGGLRFDHRTNTIDLDTFITRWRERGTEYERSYAFLTDRGLQVDSELVMSWFGHILQDKRHELLVMYYENLDDTGYIIGERDEMGRADLPAELAASIKERSLASFQILAPSN